MGINHRILPTIFRHLEHQLVHQKPREEIKTRFVPVIHTNNKKDRESLIKVHVRAYLQFNEKIRPGLDKFNGPSTLICTCTALGDSRVIFYTDILDIEF